VNSQTASLVLVLVCVATASSAQRPQPPKSPLVSHADSKAWVKHTKNGDVFVTENSSFDFVRLLRDDGRGYDWLLVQHTDHNEWSDSRDGVAGSVEVKGWALSEFGPPTLRWTFTAPGNSGRALSDLRMFQISSWPCCSSPFENIYFSLLNGKRLYTTNGRPESGASGQDAGLIGLSGGYDGSRYTQTRYIGFGAATGQRQNAPTLQYGTDEAIKLRFTLLGREYGDNFDVPAISLTVDGKPMAKDPRVDGSFSCMVVLKFDDGPEVRVPLENDALRIDKAVLPPGYSFRVENIQ
jgi:hypothetical protein